MTDWKHAYDDASGDVDEILRANRIELPDEEDADESGTFSISARKMLFSEKYSKEARAMLDGACCSNPYNNPNCTGESNLTLDHITPVSKYFNEEGWRYTRDKRDKWYTDPKNLQVLCSSCNSMKGGEPFNKNKVARCLREGRG